MELAKFHMLWIVIVATVYKHWNSISVRLCFTNFGQQEPILLETAYGHLTCSSSQFFIYHCPEGCNMAQAVSQQPLTVGGQVFL